MGRGRALALAAATVVAGVAGTATSDARSGAREAPVHAAAPGHAAVPAQAQHRAAVVVDTGSGVRTACVRFSEASITGRQALERAGMDPVFGSYSGQGTAVCALCGVGCPSSNCLNCDPRSYWAYHRAPAGTGGYSYSSAGAGSTTVRNGDVEGWRWGSGSPPPFFTIEQVCGEAAPPPRAAPAPAPAPARSGAAPTPSAGSGGGSPPAASGGGVASPTAPGGVDGAPRAGAAAGPGSPESTAGTTGPGSTSSPSSVEGQRGDERQGSREELDGQALRAEGAEGDQGDGGPAPVTSAAGFALTLAGAGYLVWRARRLRRGQA